MKRPSKNENIEIDDKMLGSMLSGEIADHGANDPGTCLTPEMISAFVSGEMGKAEKANCIDHILACPSCHKAVVICTKLNEPGKSRSFSRFRPLALAAAVLVAVFSIYLILHFFPGGKLQPFVISHVAIDENLRDFLMNNNQTTITDKISIRSVQKMLGKHNKSIASYNIRELRLKWPVRTTKDIAWKPEKVNIQIKNGVMTIEILNHPPGYGQ